MKKTLNHLSVLILTVGIMCISYNVHSQCCPYVGSLEIIPSYPTNLDSIYVVTDATTTNQGLYLGYEILDSGSVIYVNGCYYSGVLTQPENYIDTINIGLKPVGSYQIIFTAYRSNSQTNCMAIDSNSTTTTFNVGQVGVQELLETNKKLVKVIDTTGRPTKEEPNKLLIYIYSDGTTEKVFKLK